MKLLDGILELVKANIAPSIPCYDLKGQMEIDEEKNRTEAGGASRRTVEIWIARVFYCYHFEDIYSTKQCTFRATLSYSKWEEILKYKTGLEVVFLWIRGWKIRHPFGTCRRHPIRKESSRNLWLIWKSDLNLTSLTLTGPKSNKF